jgi:hypothetical protein
MQVRRSVVFALVTLAAVTSGVLIKFNLLAGVVKKTSVDDVKRFEVGEVVCATSAAEAAVEFTTTGSTQLRYRHGGPVRPELADAEDGRQVLHGSHGGPGRVDHRCLLQDEVRRPGRPSVVPCASAVGSTGVR